MQAEIQKYRKKLVMRHLRLSIGKAGWRGWFSLISVVCVLVLNSVLLLTFLLAQAAHGQDNTSALYQSLQARAAIPFMHRPYYGNRTVLQRAISYVDHDKPWYANDNIFVRFDGLKLVGHNASVINCSPNVSCYDGHNGYDLNLWFEPVLSVAAGTVVRANWYNPLDHNSSLGLWTAIDHGNGFVTAYGHLSALTVSVGTHVGVQWQIGTSGTTGASMGPHLHMASYYLPYWYATDPFGWKSNYQDPNIVPDRYLWTGNPGTSPALPDLSSTGRAPYPGAILVDDGGSGWSSIGSWQQAVSRTDINSRLHWTMTTSSYASAAAIWRPALPADGEYEVGVFVDDNYATSSWAGYTVYSADPNYPGLVVQRTVRIDQSHIGRFRGPFGIVTTGPQWVSLGTYYFRRGLDNRVVLNNATGEVGQQLAADAVEFARAGWVAGSATMSYTETGPTNSAQLVQPQPVPTPVIPAPGPASVLISPGNDYKG